MKESSPSKTLCCSLELKQSAAPFSALLPLVVLPLAILPLVVLPLAILSLVVLSLAILSLVVLPLADP